MSPSPNYNVYELPDQEISPDVANHRNQTRRISMNSLPRMIEPSLSQYFQPESPFNDKKHKAPLQQGKCIKPNPPQNKTAQINNKPVRKIYHSDLNTLKDRLGNYQPYVYDSTAELTKKTRIYLFLNDSLDHFKSELFIFRRAILSAGREASTLSFNHVLHFSYQTYTTLYKKYLPNQTIPTVKSIESNAGLVKTLEGYKLSF